MMAHWNYSLTLRSPEQAPSRNQVIHTTTSYINLTRTSTTSKVSSHTCVMAFCYFIIALVFLCAFLHIRQRHKRRVLWTTASLSTPGANTQSIGNRELDNEKYATSMDLEPLKEADVYSREAVVVPLVSQYSLPPYLSSAPWRTPPLSPAPNPYYSPNHPLTMGGVHPQESDDIPEPTGISCLSISQCHSATRLHENARFFFGRRMLGHVRVLAKVVSIDTRATNIIYHLNDGTARIEALWWLDWANTADDDRGYLNNTIIENMCVCVTGTLKQFGNKRYISATRISPLKNPHKLNYFAPLLYQESLSRIQPLIPNKTHPTTTPRPNYPSVVPCTFSVNADGEHDMIPDLLTLKRKIVNFMQHYVRTHQPTVESLHIDAIAHGVEAGVWEVRGALDNLIDEGAVYYTFDDFHFACTDYNFIVTPNGAYDMVPLLPAMHRKIVHFILGHRRTMVGGVHISAIARGVGTDVREAREALNSLVDAAEVFSTIDDSHFDINFPMAAGNEQVFGSTNEYHRHVSSSIPAHASQVSASGTYDMFADLPSLQRKITGFIQKQPTTEMGVHISAIADALGMDINNLSDALDKLLDDGYVYNTIDDSHFQVTF